MGRAYEFREDVISRRCLATVQEPRFVYCGSIAILEATRQIISLFHCKSPKVIMDLQEVKGFAKLDLESLVHRLAGAFNITESLLSFPGGVPPVILIKIEELKEMISAIPEEEDLLRNEWILRYLEIYEKFMQSNFIQNKPKTELSLVKKEQELSLVPKVESFNILAKINELKTLAHDLSMLLLDGTSADQTLIESQYANLKAAVESVPKEHEEALKQWKQTLVHYEESMDKKMKTKKTNEKAYKFKLFKDTCHQTMDLLRSLAVAMVLPRIDWIQIDENMATILNCKSDIEQYEDTGENVISFLACNTEHAFLLYDQLKERENEETKLKMLPYTFKNAITFDPVSLFHI